MDPGSGCSDGASGQVAGDDRSFCHLAELSPSDVFFSVFADPMSAGTDAFLQSWDGLQAHAFLTFLLILQVLNKLRTCKGMLLTLIAPYWTQRD